MKGFCWKLVHVYKQGNNTGHWTNGPQCLLRGLFCITLSLSICASLPCSVRARLSSSPLPSYVHSAHLATVVMQLICKLDTFTQIHREASYFHTQRDDDDIV